MIKMLSDKVMERLAEALVDKIEELNTTILEEIGAMIKKIGTLTPSKAQQLAQSLRYGASYNKIVNKLAEITELNAERIYEIFEEVAKKNQDFAKQFYDYKEIDFIPYEENIALQRQVKAMARLTAENYINLTNSSAFMTIENGRKVFTPISQIYDKCLDKAVLSIVQGKEDYYTSMRRTMRELAENGIRTIDYASGYSRRLDSSVRQNILDGMRQMSNEIQQQFGEEFGADGVEISVHLHPAKDHEDIQGGQYSISEFNQLNASLERPISTMNCYHYIFSIILGVSRPAYTKKQLKEIKQKNKDGFEFEGKHYTMYEGTQLQRQIETKIRTLKDRQIGARAIGDMEEVGHCQEKISQLNKKYKELSNISGLPTKKQRMTVSGYKRIAVNNKK